MALNPRKIAENQVVPVDVSKELARFAADGLKTAHGDPEEIAAVLGDMPVTIGNGEKRPLKDFAVIETDSADITSFAMLNGKETSAFSVYQAPGASDVKVAEEVAAKVKVLAETYPNVTFELVDSSAPYTLGNFHSALHTLWEGAILTVLVVFLFLRNIRATIIAAIALPLSIVPAFWAMDMLGFSLNLVSLLGITIVTGILVDDAIVEIENMAPHADGQAAIAGLDGGFDRDRPHHDRDLPHHYRGVRSGELHGRHRRALLHRVRAYRIDGGAVLAAGGAAAHPGAQRPTCSSRPRPTASRRAF